LIKIVLGAVQDRLEREPLVIDGAQHHQRNVGREREQAVHGVEAFAVGQHQVDQNGVVASAAQAPRRLFEGRRARYLKPVDGASPKEVRGQDRVGEVVIDEQHLIALERGHRLILSLRQPVSNHRSALSNSILVYE
jgi:hypothetical protein